MNTIDLLDKLNLPSKIGLEGEDALFNKKTIMDAYLSAASLQFNRQLFGMDSLCTGVVNDRSSDSLLTLNHLAGDMPKPSGSFDLFKMYTGDAANSSTEVNFNDTKVVLDLMKIRDYPLTDMYDNNKGIFHSQEASNSQSETELESYTKLETDHVDAQKPKKTRGKKKNDKLDINEFVSDERRRLLKKLESCEEERTIFKRRVKNNKKDPKISADNYRGSRFWGVSKNKSKWQVMITLNHYKEYKGGFESEEEAARMYDKKSICTFGLKAKTNFDYSKREVLEILRDDESIIM